MNLSLSRMASPKAVSRLRSPIAVAIAAAFLTACGGGDSTPAAPTSLSGVVVDGYIANATVNCLQADQVIASTSSDAAGRFSFDLGEGQRCEFIEAIGGIDIGLTPDDPSDDVVHAAGIMRTVVPADADASRLDQLVVSPLTTLVAALVGAGATPAAAADQVRNSLGLPAGVDVLGADPVTDPGLYKTSSVVAQTLNQITAAMAAADPTADRGALANAAIQALATSLGSLSFEALTPSPGALAADSPLVALVAAAVSNAQAAGALSGVQPDTLALIAAPLVAAATHPLAGGADIEALIAQVNVDEDRDRMSVVIGGARNVLGGTVDDPGALLNQLSDAIESSTQSGGVNPLTLVVGGQSANVSVPGGLSNVVAFALDSVVLVAPGAAQYVPLADFAGGVRVPRNLSQIGFTLEAPGPFTQLDTPIEVPLALELRDATRVFQARIDRVRLERIDNRVAASLPQGATLVVYGRTATTETTTPMVVALAGSGLSIVRTESGSPDLIRIDVDAMFDTIGGAAAPGSALGQLAANRVSGGSYAVKLAIDTLRVARVTGSQAALVPVQAITLGAGGGSVAGRGLAGMITVQ